MPVEQVVEDAGTASVYFGDVGFVGVGGEDVLRHKDEGVVEYLVAEEEVAEESGVGVGVVVGELTDHVGQVGQRDVHLVVVEGDRVEVGQVVPVDAVVAYYFLHQLHPEPVGVREGGRLEGHGHRSVGQLVVPEHHHGGGEDRLAGVEGDSHCVRGQALERRGEGGQLLEGKGAGAGNDNVRPDEVDCLVLFQVLGGQQDDVLADAGGRLPDEVVPEAGVVGVFFYYAVGVVDALRPLYDHLLGGL